MNDLQKVLYGLGFKLILKRDNRDRALIRVNAGADAVATDVNIFIRDISWCLPSIGPSNDNRIIVQKGLNKKNSIVISYYEKRQFIRMYPMLQTSYLILVWRVVWEDHNI